MKIAQPMMNMQVSRYRKSAGPEPTVMMGFPCVVLTTVGAKSGQERTHILGGFNDGDDAWLIVASKGGAPTHPAWYINLANNPDKVWLEAGNRKFKVKPVLVRGAQRDAAMAKISAIAPRYGEYDKKTDRQIPVIRLTPE
jgi:deazaflavin-dependent oxidoreductase (nitroreductase family)